MSTALLVRREAAADRRTVETLVRDAFWNVYQPGATEHAVLHRLREDEAFIPELSLVAVLDGTIAGHVAGVRGVIHGRDGRDRSVITLGPIAVRPDLQRQGIGRALISRFIEVARSQQAPAVLLCGDPDYYGRLGFSPAERFGICTADGFYADALQALELLPDALEGAGGRYVEAPVFSSLTEDEIEAFDRNFEPREKLCDTPSQRRLLEIVARARPAED